MQQVSQAYKDSMKSPLRERGYIMLSFGLVNQEAQTKATVDSGAFLYYSSASSLFSETQNTMVYATLEENFTRVDGEMYFLPRQTTDAYYDTGLVSGPLVSQGAYTVTINLHTEYLEFRGMTIDFGENYPVNFDVVADGYIYSVRGNTDSKYVTEEVFYSTGDVQIVVHQMKNPQSRLRIKSILFGYGLVYQNESVLSSTLESYVSPVGADIPQIDFSVQLTNYDKYFNVDNPKSAIHFLETGQEMRIYYGYQLPNSNDIEWLPGSRLLCSEWESDDYTATIRCQDVLRNLDMEYYKGTVDSNGISYYDLAVDVLEDAGLEAAEHYVDPRLESLYTANPMPRVSHKEALQIIANACRCALSQTRDGKISIKSSFVPDATITAPTGEAAFSDVSAVLENTVKNEYATLSTNYTVSDGGMYFLPRSSQSIQYLNTGFVSSAVSDSSGNFSTAPRLEIVQEAACMYYGLKLVFGQALPARFTIRTYRRGTLVDVLTVSENITKNMIIHYTFRDFDTMKIWFQKTAEPQNRVVVNYIAFGDITDFTMSREDMLSPPKAIKQELVKEVVVPYYSYQNETTEESLAKESVTVSANEKITFFLSEPANGFRATINGSSNNVAIRENGSYFVTVQIRTAGTYQVEVFGYKYKVSERYAVQTLNAKGKTVRWENPLMSDAKMAADLAEWLGDYYKTSVEYEYDTRGNPEIDANDIIYQENEFCENMKVNVYRQVLNFNQGFSGKISARRMGG